MEKNTLIAYAISSFSFGLIFSLFGNFFLYFLLYYILFELIVLLYYRKNYNIRERLLIVGSSIFGYVFGRIILNEPKVWNDF
jgi:hypothetical protein